MKIRSSIETQRPSPLWVNFMCDQEDMLPPIRNVHMMYNICICCGYFYLLYLNR
jgi:hypothetical protein